MLEVLHSICMLALQGLKIVYLHKTVLALEDPKGLEVRI